MELSPDHIRRMEALIRDVKQAAGARCATTGVPLGPHDVLASIALGRKDAPLSLAELAREEGQPLHEFRERLLTYMQARPCHNAAWLWASEEAGFGRTMFPPLEWGDEPDSRPQASGAPESTAGSVNEAAHWDAGDMGCGDLVLELRQRLKDMKPGEVLKLHATDLGAPEDLPAWCQMTGNALIKRESNFYWIRRKGD